MEGWRTRCADDPLWALDFNGRLGSDQCTIEALQERSMKMKCVANYEIETECSVVSDELVLNINHPSDLYRARIKNIPRSDFSNPFLLSLHLYFEAPTLDDARDMADDLLADCLNMLAFTTGSGFRRHKIRQIVDASPLEKGSMRSVLMWGDNVEHQDPQPFLSEGIATGIERLLTFDIPPPVRRALRWYRLAVDSDALDDQFAYFWFALEILAEFRKSTVKVNDKCPQCQSPLYCETCKSHPVHRPYAKQAIRDLLMSANPEFSEDSLSLLDKTRNSLMHGATLREIEQGLPDPHEKIVDTLGHAVWKALVLQFPRDMFDGTLEMGAPSTYVHYTAHGVAHINTVVPLDSDGNFDLSFKGMTVSLVPNGPPQSALPSLISMTEEQYDRLGVLSYSKVDQNEMLKRIHQRVQRKGNRVVALVLATDMACIKGALARGEVGPWQDLFREMKAQASKSKDVEAGAE